MSHRPTRRRALGHLLAGAAMPVLAGCEATRLAEAPSRKPAEGGIGGTGIVGVMTDIGSILINGLRVETGDRTDVVGPEGTLPLAALAPGLSLTVEADGPADALFARRVTVNPPLSGPIAMGDDGDLTVNGVPLRLPVGVPALVSLGDRVMVSGLWDAGVVVVSRFDPLAARTRDRIAGVAGRDAAGAPTIGQRRLRLPAAIAAPDPGVFATAVGRDVGDAFAVEAVEVGRFSPGFRNLARLSIEGYLERQAAAPGFAISGLGHSLDPGAQMTALEGKRAVIEGPYDGRFAADRGLILPEAADSRRTLLSLRLDGTVGPDIALR